MPSPSTARCSTNSHRSAPLCPLGNTTSAEYIIELCERLNPARVPGRLTLISRMGAEKVTTLNLKVVSTDAGSTRDFQAFAKQTGNTLLDQQTVDKEFIHFMRRR